MTGSGEPERGALARVKVVELGSMVAGPLCGQILGDMGADVIKVEPIGGEIMRQIPPVYDGTSAAFAQWNRNKRSVSLNLKTEEGLRTLKQLIQQADVFIHNLKTGAAGRLGLDHEMLIKSNPGLISLEMSGYGATGPYSDQPCFDMMVQGLTGFMPIQGSRDKPRAIRSIIADKVIAYSAAIAVLSALVFKRDSGGRGQKVSANILDSYASFMLPDHFYTRSFVDQPREAPFTADIYNLIQLKDGYVIGYLLTAEQFEAACDAFDRPDLLKDERFTTPRGRNIHQPELISEISQSLGDLSCAELLARAREFRLPFAAVNDLDGFTADPQVIHNGTVVEFDDERLGRIRLLKGLANMSETPINARSMAPELGADTDAVLGELGYSQEAIATLKRNGAVA